MLIGRMDWPFTLHEALWAAGVFLLSLVASTAIVVSLLVLIGPDYFVRTRRASTDPADPLAPGRRSQVRRLLLGIAKNLLGVVLVLVGLLLSIPGVPGQGLLTILVGVMLLDLPHKRRLELRIVSRPFVRRTIDRLRARFGRPPILVDPPVAPPGDGPANPSATT